MAASSRQYAVPSTLFGMLCLNTPVALLIVIFIFAALPSWGLPPEGLDNFAVNGRGTAKTSIVTHLEYVTPRYMSDHGNLEAIVSTPTAGGNLWTVGGGVTTNNTWGDRTNALGRFDLRFGSLSSVAFKYIYSSWGYMQSSRDLAGVDLNTFFDWGGKSGVYFTFGGYYRWLRQRWNDNWWRPLNFDTRDQQGMLYGVLGWQQAFGAANYLTFDVNFRDHFEYYNIDSSGYDLKLNFAGGPGFYWTTFVSLRTASLLVGTWYGSSWTFGVGFSIY